MIRKRVSIRDVLTRRQFDAVFLLKDFTQSEVARRLKISQPAVCRLRKRAMETVDRYDIANISEFSYE